MKIEDFRKAPHLVDWLNAVTGHQNWAMLLAALEGSHPRKDGISVGATQTDCVKKLGVIEGYDLALDSIYRASMPFRSNELPEPTFGTKPEEE